MKPKTSDFVSPPDVAGLAAGFLGGIDLDPASSEHANSLVGAEKYFKEEDKGLNQIWKGRTVYLFPPTTVLDSKEQPEETLLFARRKRFRKSAQRVWLEEALKKYNRQEYDEGIIFLTSSDVALLVTQKLEIDLPLCIMRERPELFYDKPGLPKAPQTRCYGFIMYIPSPYNSQQRVLEFMRVFSQIGRVYV